MSLYVFTVSRGCGWRERELNGAGELDGQMVDYCRLVGEQVGRQLQAVQRRLSLGILAQQVRPVSLSAQNNFC
jgi:hypothetical protein